MKTIKFFHPEETFTYYIEKSFCKVVYSGKRNQLLIEIHSTDDLDHVEDDSLQNDFPQVTLSIDDFPINASSINELNGKTINIPFCFAEVEDQDGEIEEVYYTNVSFDEDYFEADGNSLTFSKNEKGTLCVNWKGEVQDFISDSDDKIPFEVSCAFDSKAPDIRD